MSDEQNRFHEIALNSGLFKGRSDWYFCYLKSEKITHVLILLSQRSGQSGNIVFDDLIAKASLLPQIIARLAAGQASPEGVLADIFGLLTSVRLCVAQNLISKGNGTILEAEYERIAERIAAGSVVSPFLSNDDFSLPVLPQEKEYPEPHPLLQASSQNHFPVTLIRDSNKGQSKGHKIVTDKQKDRTLKIIEVVRKNKGVSVGDIASVVKGCSEKTIQRELATLISKGVVRKQGERRWSLYFSA